MAQEKLEIRIEELETKVRELTNIINRMLESNPTSK